MVVQMLYHAHVLYSLMRWLGMRQEDMQALENVGGLSIELCPLLLCSALAGSPSVDA